MNDLDTQLDRRFETLTLLVREILGSAWLELVEDLRADHSYEDVTYMGLRRAPAAKANHHDRVGGLVEHMLEMWDIHTQMPKSPPIYGNLDGQRILAGIILHDLHKGWCHFVEDPKAPSGVNYGRHPSSKLLTADQKTVYIASKYVTLDIMQLNAVYHSEGGWAASPPQWSSVLAKYLYLLDELSSNVKDRISTPSTDTNVFVVGDKGVTTRLSTGFDLL